MELFTLNAMDIQYIAMLAERRNIVKEVHGVRNQKKSDYSNFSVHYHGLMGEQVASKILGEPINETVSLYGDDKVSDFVVNGIKIQVKACIGKYTRPMLVFGTKEKFAADLAMLFLAANATDVYFAGWMDRLRWVKDSTIYEMHPGKFVYQMSNIYPNKDDLLKYVGRI